MSITLCWTFALIGMITQVRTLPHRRGRAWLRCCLLDGPSRSVGWSHIGGVYCCKWNTIKRLQITTWTIANISEPYPIFNPSLPATSTKVKRTLPIGHPSSHNVCKVTDKTDKTDKSRQMMNDGVPIAFDWNAYLILGPKPASHLLQQQPMQSRSLCSIE